MQFYKVAIKKKRDHNLGGLLLCNAFWTMNFLHPKTLFAILLAFLTKRMVLNFTLVVLEKIPLINVISLCFCPHDKDPLCFLVTAKYLIKNNTNRMAMFIIAAIKKIVLVIAAKDKNKLC
jgi:hypothetical protein